MKNIGFIPARGGSKGVPGKNIRLVNGRPLIGYTIAAALQSQLDKVVVSSDSKEILEISEKFVKSNYLELSNKLILHNRPEEFSGDLSPINQAIDHYLNSYWEKYENIVLLQPTSPVRKYEHINDCLKIVSEDQEIESIVSVSHPFEHPAEMIVRHGNRNSLLLPDFAGKQRQEYGKVYFINGSIYLVKMEKYQKIRKFYYEDTYLYEMDNLYSLDVDTFSDLIMAESVIKFLDELHKKTISLDDYYQAD